jgi:hypothetical protein
MHDVAFFAFSQVPADFSRLMQVEFAVKKRIDQFLCSLTIHARLAVKTIEKLQCRRYDSCELVRAFVIIANYYEYRPQPVFIPEE